MSTIMDKTEEVTSEKAEIEPKFNLIQFLKEVRVEFSKITWPSKEQTVREFFSVVLLVAALTGIIFLIDKAFEIIVNFFSGRLYL